MDSGCDDNKNHTTDWTAAEAPTTLLPPTTPLPPSKNAAAPTNNATLMNDGGDALGTDYGAAVLCEQ